MLVLDLHLIDQGQLAAEMAVTDPEMRIECVEMYHMAIHVHTACWLTDVERGNLEVPKNPG